MDFKDRYKEGNVTNWLLQNKMSNPSKQGRGPIAQTRSISSPDGSDLHSTPWRPAVAVPEMELSKAV